MLREFTCIMCPQGCTIEVEAEGKEIKNVTGNRCPKGKAYVEQEIVDPKRNIATSVLVKGGTLPLASCRLTAMIPKDRIFDVMAEIRKVKVEAPVSAGDIVIKDVLGLGADVMITKTVEAA